jgi:hypothetical protein
MCEVLCGWVDGWMVMQGSTCVYQGSLCEEK